MQLELAQQQRKIENFSGNFGSFIAESKYSNDADSKQSLFSFCMVQA